MGRSRTRELFQAAGESWLAHDAATAGAALAFYALLSLAPLVMLAMAAGGIVFGGGATEQRLVGEVQFAAGGQVARVVQALADQTRNPVKGASASAAGIATLFLGASGVFLQLRIALHTALGIPPQNGFGLKGVIRERLASIGMVLIAGFVLILSLVITAGLAAAGELFSERLPIPAELLYCINFGVSFLVILCVFALILRYAPDAKLDWRSAFAGATVSALLFTIGKTVIAFYLTHAAIGSLYGAGGSIVAVTVWVYYSALMFLYGAEFACAYKQCAPVRST